MAIKVSALLKQEATAEIKFFDERGSVKFRPGAITDDLVERVQTAAEADDESVLNRLLAEVCISWDVVDDAGEMVPFTDEGLKAVPVPFKGAVLQQIVEQAQGNSQPNEPVSRAGSRRKAR